MSRYPRRLGLLLVCMLAAGCSAMNDVVPDSVTGAFDREGVGVPFCEALYDHNDWLDGAVAAESRWGIPIYVSLAELNMSLGTEASQYIDPSDADWQSYRIETENWQAQKGDIVAALDFLGWHGQLAVERNQLTLEQAGQLYLSSRLGHGGYHRFQYQPDLLLQRQSEQVQQRAITYREQLSQCPRIRERAGSFFRWPW